VSHHYLSHESSLWRSVPLHVKCKVIRARERPMAKMTFERFRTRVLPRVSSELVTPGEGPGTSRPGACVWLFPSVSSSMGLQVGALCVHLHAARIFTPMLPPMPLSGLTVSEGGKWQLLEHRGETDRRHSSTRRHHLHLHRHRWPPLQRQVDRFQLIGVREIPRHKLAPLASNWFQLVRVGDALGQEDGGD